MDQYEERKTEQSQAKKLWPWALAALVVLLIWVLV